MIPKIIHYCWFGRGTKGQLEQNCIEGWKAKLPDYTFMEWNEENFDINQFSFARDAYHAKKFAFVSDVCRLHALREYGGIYLDTDVQVLRSFNDLLNGDKFIMGMEDDFVVSSACILSSPNHPIINKLLDFYQNAAFKGEVFGKEGLLPNTHVISEILKQEYGLRLHRHFTYSNEAVTIYPVDYFSPKNYADKRITLTVNSYCVHLFNGSWISKSTKFKEFILRNTPPFFYGLYKKLKHGEQ